MAVAIIFLYKRVVKDEVFVAGVVRRVDIDALDPTFIGDVQVAQCIEVVTFDQYVFERRLAH